MWCSIIKYNEKQFFIRRAGLFLLLAPLGVLFPKGVPLALEFIPNTFGAKKRTEYQKNNLARKANSSNSSSCHQNPCPQIHRKVEKWFSTAVKKISL
jgi:hypothetical protein